MLLSVHYTIEESTSTTYIGVVAGESLCSYGIFSISMIVHIYSLQGEGHVISHVTCHVTPTQQGQCNFDTNYIGALMSGVVAVQVGTPSHPNTLTLPW